MEEAGFFNDKFQIGCGDSFEISDDDSVPDSKAAEGKGGRKGPGRGGTKAGLPLIVEGDKELTASLGKYKKALLNKRTVLKEVKDRLVEESAVHTSLLSHSTHKHCLVHGYESADWIASVACCDASNRGMI